MLPTSNEEIIYILGYVNPNKGAICKRDYSLSTVDCGVLTSDQAPRALVLLSDTSFFLSVDATILKLAKFTFGSTTATWAKSANCPTSGCTTHFSEALFDQTLNHIHTLTSFGSPQKGVFLTLDNADGSLVSGTKFASSIT